jgi:5-methylcytosine-specific restriction endonuclease McrBC GTP-binding regulatory subunit McrB
MIIFVYLIRIYPSAKTLRCNSVAGEGIDLGKFDYMLNDIYNLLKYIEYQDKIIDI